MTLQEAVRLLTVALPALAVGYVGGLLSAPARDDATFAAAPASKVAMTAEVHRGNQPTPGTHRSVSEGGDDPAGGLSALRDSLASLSDDQLTTLAVRLGVLKPEEAAALRHPRQALDRIAGIAMAGAEPVSDTGRLGWISLSNQPPSEQQIAGSSQFSPADETIYAIFPTDTYALGSVLVKWFRTDQPQVLLLRTLPVQPARGINHVFVRRTGGWPPGRYRVEIYAMDDEVGLLAASDYSVNFR